MEPSNLKSLPLFASLSRKELALVARHADELEVPAGRELVREGEVAREFFVIVSGTATVSKQGEPVAELGPGDFLGEIGLLETERRIATVTADTPMSLLVMFGPEFTAVESEIQDLHTCIRRAIDRRMGID